MKDNGPGLSQDEQARLFAPFTRLALARAKGDRGTPSHSYLWMNKCHEVWTGFRAIREIFRQ